MSTYIPFDLQVPIIERLPVKSLIRFKSVCKRWNSFINSSHFITGYKIRPNHPHHLFIRYEIEDWKQTEVKYVSFLDDDTFPQKKSVPIVPQILKLLNRSSIIGSSHGLLCFNGLFRESNSSITNMAVIWNPSTRKSIAVVVPNVLSFPFAHVVGFGVCPQTNDLKIVNIRYIDPLQSTEIESMISCIPKQVQVFTLSSGKWKDSCRNLPRKSIEFMRSQIVIGRFIYWLTNDKKDDGFVDHNLIMSFDLSTEEFREVEVPNYLYNSFVSISKLRESLVLLDYSIVVNPIEVCGVWMMMDDGESKTFTKLFTIKGPGSSVLGFRKTGEPIIEMQDDNEDINEPYPLVVFCESCIDPIKDLGIPKSNSFSMSSYTESLLLLDHDDGHIVRCGAVKP